MQTIDDTAKETVKEYLPKAAKLLEAEKALYLADIKDLLSKDRARVDRYYNKTVFGEDKESQVGDADMGDIMICDNITINDKPSTVKTEPTAAKTNTWLAPLITALACLCGGVGGAGLVAMLNKPAVQNVAPITDADTDTNTQYELSFDGQYEIVK